MIETTESVIEEMLAEIGHNPLRGSPDRHTREQNEIRISQAVVPKTLFYWIKESSRRTRRKSAVAPLAPSLSTEIEQRIDMRRNRYGLRRKFLGRSRIGSGGSHGRH